MISLLNANALKIPLADKSVQCAVTSPPYWGLRDYGVSNQLGLESTPEEYTANMVQVFREVWRVLRDDGVLFLNLGDSYYTQPAGNKTWGDGVGSNRHYESEHIHQAERRIIPGLKPKDLVGIPWRVAFALQADGWYLRSDIIWAKPNPMPESVTDRPTKAHEYVFLMSKNQRYYYDAEAVKEPANPEHFGRYKYEFWPDGTKEADGGGRPNGASNTGGTKEFTGTRNRRTVWTIATEPYKGAHFATYPTALVEPCIKAGTSEKGACPKCGKPWERVVEKGELIQCGHVKENHNHKRADEQDSVLSQSSALRTGLSRESITTGWQPACKCDAGDPIPCLVLDPFAGSGTTLLVARELGRSAIGLDLSMSYLREQAYKRLEMHDLFAGQT